MKISLATRHIHQNLILLLMLIGVISCTPLTSVRSSDISTVDLDNNDTSCSYFYFLWGTHEEYYQRYGEALDAYQKALVCDPKASYVQRKLPILYLKMDSPNKAIDLLLANLEKSPDDINQRALLARIYIQQKNEPEALIHYRKIIEEDPENGQALLRVGILLTQAGDLQNATNYFNRLLELDRETYFARLYLARIADQLDHDDEAERQYAAALELNYSNDLSYEIGDFFLRRKQYEKVIDTMRQLLGHDNTDERARFTIVQSLLALDREEEAVAELSLAKEISSNPEKISLILSRLYLRNGDNDKARENLESVLEVTENSEARYLLAVLHMEAERWEDALEMLAAISPIDDEFEDSVVLQSRIYHQNNEVDKGLELLRRLLEDKGTQRELFYILASSLYQENGQPARATETLKTGIEQFPDSEKLLFEYGLQLERTGRLEEAIAVMEKIIERNPDHPEALNFVGYSWADTDRNLDQALVYILRAMELKPGNGYIQDSLGWVYFKLGKLEAARNELTQALELVPDDPHIYDHLGDVYRSMGMPAKALKAYTSALEYFEDPVKKAMVQDKIESISSP